jgi:hypothetical protein
MGPGESGGEVGSSSKPMGGSGGSGFSTTFSDERESAAAFTGSREASGTGVFCRHFGHVTC